MLPMTLGKRRKTGRRQRRRASLVSQTRQYVELCIDDALLILSDRRTGRFYTSIDDTWPPSIREAIEQLACPFGDVWPVR